MLSLYYQVHVRPLCLNFSNFSSCNQKIVEEVRYFHDQPGRRHDFYDKRLHFRSVSPLTEAMVVFGGLRVDGSPSNMMLAFDFNTHAWCSLGTTPFDLGQGTCGIMLRGNCSDRHK